METDTGYDVRAEWKAGPSPFTTHLIQEVELRHVGGLCEQQLVSDVEDPLMDRQL